MEEERCHRSVLLAECLELMKVRDGGRYADLTFGEGGHTEAMLDAGAAHVLAVDRDADAVERYRRQGRLRDDARLRLVEARFSTFPEVAGDERFDAILVDLGVSTRQLTSVERGFSFAGEGPLDMRMDRSAPTLDERLSAMSQEELAEALWTNADLKHPYGWARKILEAHAAGNLSTTGDLARLAGPKRPGHSHPATPLFLALRMLVNDELGEVQRGLPALADLLVPGGRLAVITFHSTEDRVVKKLFKKLAGQCICDRYPCVCPRTEVVSLVTKKPVVPGEDELRGNPRARSAKLRVVDRPSHVALQSRS